MQVRHAEVAPTNADQARAWDGAEGERWAAYAEHFERALAAYDRHIFSAAAIGADTRVLDVGCGTGSTTRAAARLARAGSALGLDLSGAMVGVARAAAAREGLTNVRFEQGDAEVFAFPDAAFDVVLSRTAVMFFGDPVAAFGNLARALRPGGRLAVLVWQGMDRNEWMSSIAAVLTGGRPMPVPPPGVPGPFAMSDRERLPWLLGRSGFDRVHVEGVEEPMWFGSDAADAHRFVLASVGWMLDGLDSEGRAQALAGLTRLLEAHATADGVTLGSAAWLVSAQI